MIYRFGERSSGQYELDEEAGALRRNGRAVEVQPKPLALLLMLVRERQRVVPQGELFAALWPGVAVTPSSLTRAVSMARRAIGDTHRGGLLRSVARRGYRFTGEVIEIGAAAQGAPQSTESSRAEAASAAFVGRDDALESLRAMWREALAGRGGVALVEGPPGIGKTRLAEVFGAEAERAGGIVLTGRSREGEGVPAFWLWAQVLRRLQAHELGAEALTELADAPEELTALLDAARAAKRRAAHAALAPEQQRFLLFDAVVRTLARATRRRPMLLVLEDLQWAGSPSLRLLEHLAFEVPELPILVLATVRDEHRDDTHPVERLLPRLRQQSRCEGITLSGFTRREVAALLEHEIGAPPPPDLSSELFARTEGVPLFVREAIRLLAERGDLRQPEPGRRWGVTLPARALDLIRQPLDRLPPACAALIGAAAVLGRDFQGALAAAVAEVDRGSAVDLLDEATANGVIEAAEAPGTWRFTHALFQEAALQGLAGGTRARLHLRAAAELERRHGDTPDIAAELAHHHHAALAVGDPERAFACAQRAAQRATRLLAHEQAATHWTQAVAALDHGEPVDSARRLGASLALGEAHRLAGDRAARRAVFGAAMEAARALGRPLERARAAIGFCDLSEWSPADEEARAVIEAALAEVPADAAGVRARLLTRFAYLSARGDFARAVPTAREAVEQARASGDAEARQDALYTLNFLLAGPDHLAARDALAREAETVAREGGTADPTVIALLDRASDGIVAGDAAAMRHWRAAAGEIAGTDPHLGRVWHLRVWDASHALLEGRFDDADRMIDESAQIGRRIEHPYARGVARTLRAQLARERGDDAEVLQIFDPTPPIRFGPVHFVLGLVGRALTATGRIPEATAVFADLIGPGAERIPRNIRWYVTTAEAALLAAELGDVAHAESLLALLEPHADQHAVLPLAAYSGPIARCLAHLEATLGHVGRAGDRFEEAVEAAVAIGARPMQARALVEHGTLLARHGDRRAARERLAAGSQIAEDLGMAGVVEAARAALP